jgi:hypothetical protein
VLAPGGRWVCVWGGGVEVDSAGAGGCCAARVLDAQDIVALPVRFHSDSTSMTAVACHQQSRRECFFAESSKPSQRAC